MLCTKLVSSAHICMVASPGHHVQRKLNVFHLRCLRRVLGVSWQDKVTINEDLHRAGISSMYILRWLGHVHWMEDGRIPNGNKNCHSASKRRNSPSKQSLKRHAGEGKIPRHQMHIQLITLFLPAKAATATASYASDCTATQEEAHLSTPRVLPP